VNGAIESLHVRCRAPQGREREALALRTRLARTARVHLPDALRGTLERPGRRVYVKRIDIALDFDPADYDDVTVAALWARRVGDAVGALGDDGPGVRVFADERAYTAAALDELGGSGTMSWVFAELGCGDGPVAAGALVRALAAAQSAGVVRGLLLEDPVRARRLYDRIAPDERDRVLDALGAASRAAARRARAVLAPAERPAEDNARAREGLPPARAAHVPAGRQPPRGAARAAPDEVAVAANGAATAGFDAWLAAIDGASRSAAQRARAGARETPARSSSADAAVPVDAPARPSGRRDAPPPARADLSPAPPAPAGDAGADTTSAPPVRATDPVPALERPGWWSIAGGLVLLWPWLRDLLAGDLPPVRGLRGTPPEVAARLWALAGLLGDEREPFLPDPLVRLLAGADPAAEHRFESAEGGAVAGTAAVLGSFAASLPGFGDSSAAFVREHLLLRGALLEPVEDDVVRVRIEPLPLDPILSRLPYPLGPFRLADTPLIVVERRSA